MKLFLNYIQSEIDFDTRGHRSKGQRGNYHNLLAKLGIRYPWNVIKSAVIWYKYDVRKPSCNFYTFIIEVITYFNALVVGFATWSHRSKSQREKYYKLLVKFGIRNTWKLLYHSVIRYKYDVWKPSCIFNHSILKYF